MTGRLTALLLTAGLVVGACGDGADRAERRTQPTPRPSASPTTAPLPETYRGYSSAVYADPAHWVCRPDMDDVCDRDLDATAVRADGSTEVVRHRPARDPAVDCFFVYPTVSSDRGLSSDPGAAEEIFVTRAEFARLSESCRTFAPVYRSLTREAVAAAVDGRGGGALAEAFQLAYTDVVDAFRHYMANDSGGRGVVLMGHSQGATMLRQLIAAEIDPQPALRQRLVSALLVGIPGAGLTPDAFSHIPPCTTSDSTGCFVTYASFLDTAPPPDDSRFGGSAAGGPAVCVNPADPAGGEVAAEPYFPQFEGGAYGTYQPPGDATTAFVTLPDFFEVRCASDARFGWLSVHVPADAADPRPVPPAILPPSWGLHLYDVMIVAGDLVRLVASQAKAYADR